MLDESALAAAPAETPTSVTETPVETPAVAVETDTQSSPEAVASPVEAPAVPVSEPSVETSTMTNPPAADAPIPDADPVVVLQARVSQLEGEADTLLGHRQRLEDEVTSLQTALDAERAKAAATPDTETLMQKVIDLKDQLAKSQLAHELTKEAQAVAPVATGLVQLAESEFEKIKDKVMEALHDHAVAQVAPPAEPAPEVTTPFITTATKQ